MQLDCNAYGNIGAHGTPEFNWRPDLPPSSSSASSSCPQSRSVSRARSRLPAMHMPNVHMHPPGSMMLHEPEKPPHMGSVGSSRHEHMGSEG